MDLMEPFSTALDLQTGILRPAGPVIKRHLSDMRGMYGNASAEQAVFDSEGDRLIYEVYAVDLPEQTGLVFFGTTIIHPGRIGAEFHMTKGHFHKKRDCSEFYLGLAGEGYLLLQADDGTVRGLPMVRGTIAYVPPFWAHRTVNTGDEPFRFLAVWPGDAGHDYSSIEHSGFAKLLVCGKQGADLIDNPAYGSIVLS
jgi:glucose-6-phosphate isomerase